MWCVRNKTWLHLSAPESEFYALTTGGAHGLHAKNIFSDLLLDLILRLDTVSTSASGICRGGGVGRLRHLHKKQLWLQDEIAAKKIELGRVSSEDAEPDLVTKILGRDIVSRNVRQRWGCCPQGLGPVSSCLRSRSLRLSGKVS